MLNNDNGKIKIAVKIGNTAIIRFSNCITYRALTIEDLNNIVKSNGCHIVVFEDIAEDEQDDARTFITEFSKDPDNYMIFLDTGDNIYTSGMADEFEEAVYTTDTDIYNQIEKLYNVCVSPYMKDRHKFSSDANPDTIGELMGLGNETDAYNNETDVSNNEFSNTDDIAVSDSHDGNLGFTVPTGYNNSENDKLIEQLKAQIDELKSGKAEAEDRVNKLANEKAEAEDRVNQLVNEKAEVENKVSQLTSDLDAERQRQADIEKQHREEEELRLTAESLGIAVPNKQNHEVIDQTESSSSGLDSDEALEEITKLRDELSNTKHDYSEAVKNLESATDLITKLQDEADAIRAEHQAILNHYNELVSLDQDVMEDPITLEQYNGILKDSENTKKLLDDANGKIEKLTKDLADTKQSSSETISDIQSKLDKANEELDELHEQIDSGEIHREVVAEYENKLADINSRNNELTRQVDNLTSKANELSEQLDKLKSEKQYRIVLTSYLEDLFGNIKNYNEQNEIEKSGLLRQITDLKDKSEDDLQETKRQYEDQIKQIQDKANNDLRQIKLEDEEKSRKEKQEAIDNGQRAVDSISEELNKTREDLENEKKQNASLSDRLTLSDNFSNSLQKQLNEARDQIAKLSSGNLESRTLLEKNNNLENTLHHIKYELDTSKQSELALTNENNSLQATNEQLKESVKNLKSNINALKAQLNSLQLSRQNVQSIPNAGFANGFDSAPVNQEVKISYNGGAKIIPVFGSGSYGVTTMALSIATKLSAGSKVLVIDMDLAYPKIDMYLKQNPACNNISDNYGTGIKKTSLSLCYMNGIRFLESNYMNLIHVITYGRSRFGYMSGVYYNLDDATLLGFDYTRFFDFLSQSYDYIVVDLGKFGGNLVNDKIITAIIKIPGVRSVAVTNSQYMTIRNFVINLKQLEINTQNLIVVSNFYDKQKVSDRSKKKISTVLNGINNTTIRLEPGIAIGCDEDDFNKVNYNNDNLNKVNVEIILGFVAR